jgi:hypothetical protein
VSCKSSISTSSSSGSIIIVIIIIVSSSSSSSADPSSCAVEDVGLRPPMSVSCQWCLLSCRGLCVGLITRTEEFRRVWCV